MDSIKTHLRPEIQPQHLHYHNADNRLHSPDPQQARAAAMMDGDGGVVAPAEGMVAANGVWMTPPTSEPRRRPASLYHELSCCSDDECATMPSWDSFSLQPGAGDPTSRPVSMHPELMSLNMAGGGHWAQKPCEENVDFHGLEMDGPIGQAYTTDDAVPVIDLRYSGAADGQPPLGLDGCPRRLSGSSLTTSGAMSDLPSYDDFSAALSEAPSYGSDYPATSNRNSIMSSVQMSPVASPRATPHSRPEQGRARSRGRATPSPRPSMRSAPYSIDGGPRTQRWSTGSYAPAPRPSASAFVYASPPDVYGMPAQRTSYQGPPPPPPGVGVGIAPGGFPAPRAPPFVLAAPPLFPRDAGGMLLPAQPPFAPHPGGPSPAQQPPPPPPAPAHGLFRMLHSNSDAQAFHAAHPYEELSDPPDLFGPLHEEQLAPPDEDMNPVDPELVPYEQELRFDGDLYTPRWVRGHGNKREGWCGICKPGRWLVLKNSAFWYDKSFTHGISAATGASFQEPLDTRRMDGNPDVWEGLCGSCNDWVALVSSKKKGTTWFRHAYKCHTHHKVKDGSSKRRRDQAANNGGSRGAKASGSKPEAHRAATPDSAGVAQTLNTPTSAPMPPALLAHSHPMGPVAAPEPLRLTGGRRVPTVLAAATNGMGNML